MQLELPSLSVKTEAAIHKFIHQATHLTLLSDGWDSVASQQYEVCFQYMYHLSNILVYSYVNWIVASNNSSEVFKVEMGSVSETGEEIAKSVKSIAAELQRIQNPGATQYIHFVSDSGGPYRKARR